MVLRRCNKRVAARRQPVGAVRVKWFCASRNEMVAILEPRAGRVAPMNTDLIERELVQSIAGAFFSVYNYFDFGLVEPIYCGALELELRDRGHQVAREVSVGVSYRGRHVAWQRLDLLVDRKVIVEVKATEILPKYAKRQLVSYLRATPFQVGLLMHFGPQPKFYRFVDTKPRPRSVSRPA